ncbi:MAG: hypothetical protein U5N55_02555 [Cypionkella sp.]|nr:hypothetical protein [Cypionkella sp.]
MGKQAANRAGDLSERHLKSPKSLQFTARIEVLGCITPARAASLVARPITTVVMAGSVAERAVVLSSVIVPISTGIGKVQMQLKTTKPPLGCNMTFIFLSKKHG